MKEKKLIKNNKYLYCPGSYDLKILQDYNEKIFVFKKYYENNDYCPFTYIFAENENVANIYSNVDEYEQDLNLEFHGQQPIKDLSTFKDFTIRVEDLSFIHTYSEKKLVKILNIYDFLLRKKNKYVKAIRNSKLFCTQNEPYFETLFVKNCRRTLHFIKVKYFIFSCLLIIKRIVKIIPYLIIFIKDIFTSTVQTYKDYKHAAYDVNFYEKNSLLSSSDKEKALKKARKKYLNKKKIYIETNKSIFALTIALFTLVFSLVQNIRSNLNIQKQNQTIQEKIIELQIEKHELNNKIIILTNELNEKNQDIEFYKQLTNLNIKQKNEFDKMNKELEKSKEEIIESIKKNDQ